jgi:hypothetical protein
MRTYEIKRHESGRFFLLSIFGTGRNFQQQSWDLALDVAESKTMLAELFKKFRPEELPEEDRQPLIDSVSDLIPVPQKANLITNGNPKTGRISLPGDPVYHSLTFRIPGSVNF